MRDLAQMGRPGQTARGAAGDARDAGGGAGGALCVALVGAGRVARVHAAAVAACGEARLSAVVAPRLAAAEELASLHSGEPHATPAKAAAPPRPPCRAFTSVAELVAQARPDAAVVCVPNDRHAAVTHELLAAGIHVLCEKPLALHPAQAAEMAAAAATAGRRLVLASKYRFVEGVMLAKTLLDAGVLGVPQEVEINFSQQVALAGHWYSNPAISGGGVLADNGPHAAELLRYLVGPVTEVTASEGPRPQNLAVEESVDLEARAGTGVRARIHLSWNEPGGDTYLRLRGSEGMVELGWERCRCRPRESDEWSPLAPGYDRGQAFRALHLHFARTIRGIRGRGDARDTTADAVASVAVVAAAHASLARGGKVRVADVSRAQ